MFRLNMPLIYRLFILLFTVRASADILTGYGNNMYGVKTAYFWTHARKSTIPDELHLSTCKPNNQFNLVSRHGARYPDAVDMDSFTALQAKLASGHTSRNYSFISTWVNRYPKDKAGSMVDLGIQEMKYLGAKYGSALRSLLAKKLSTVKLRSSHSKRTMVSARAFIEGMASGVQSGYPLSISPTVDDHVTRFYDGCSNYDSKVFENKTFMHERYDFQNSTTFQSMIRGIERRLGIMSGFLSVGDVKILYELCATELAIMNRAEWCTLLTDMDKEILEYENDLKDYYGRTYGHPVTAGMACPLVEDVFRSMDNAIDQYYKHRPYPVADLRIGHSTTIGPLLAALGLFKDTVPPTAENFAMMRNRKYFTNTVIPFSGNIAFILYDCSQGHIRNTVLRLFVNEKAMVIPACDRDVCSYADVRNYYHSMIDGCNWNNVCKNVNIDISSIVG